MVVLSVDYPIFLLCNCVLSHSLQQPFHLGAFWFDNFPCMPSWILKTYIPLYHWEHGMLQACHPAVEQIILMTIIHAWIIFFPPLHKESISLMPPASHPYQSCPCLVLFIYCLTSCGKKGNWEKMLLNGEESAVLVVLATEFLFTVWSVNAEVQQMFQGRKILALLGLFYSLYSNKGRKPREIKLLVLEQINTWQVIGVCSHDKIWSCPRNILGWF